MLFLTAMKYFNGERQMVESREGGGGGLLKMVSPHTFTLVLVQSTGGRRIGYKLAGISSLTYRQDPFFLLMTPDSYTD